MDPKLKEFVLSWSKEGDYEPRKKVGFE